ncbi:MAG TPA: HNH endonuclease signature motif containing protein [Mycobacterium sp.]|nr:HNH endonuclease signature motif containing protein [Mycobacterium sp.]
MASSALADRDTVLGALAAIEAGFDVLASASLDGFTPRELMDLLARREVIARRAPVADHRILQQLQTQASPGELGATTWGKVLAGRLHVSAGEATRRVHEAAELGPRTAMTGEPLEPVLPTFATAQAAGAIGAEHIRITRAFFKDLPADVDRPTRAAAEKDRARMASQFGPEEYRKTTALLMALLHPDGDLDDGDRQRRRGAVIGRQGADGLSTLSGTLTPECRAVFEAILAKLAAPGMCNPEDAQPCVTGRPSAEQIANDRRSAAQRCHDALLAAGRIVLSTKSLGELNGLPVTVIVTTTLAELEAGAGVAVTGGGSRLPMPDLIRAAAEAYHYLVIFNGAGKVLHLGRSKRTASAAQRIALHGRDHGCTRPGCTASGYQCQVHHLETDWADGGLTDIDTLTLACGPDNRMCTEFGWDTRLNSQGRVEWIPPPGLDHGQPRVNSFHHPQDLLAGLANEDSAVTETRLRHVFGDRAPVPTVSGLERSSPPTEPDRHDDDIYRRLLEFDETDHPYGHHPDDLSAYYHDIFGCDDGADAYDDFYLNLDPDLLATLDPDHDLIDDKRWTPRHLATRG